MTALTAPRGVFAACLLLVACGPGGNPDPDGGHNPGDAGDGGQEEHFEASLEGRVVDSLGVPLAGATVKVGAASAESDEVGHFALAGLPAGTVNVFARKQGYSTAHTRIHLAAGDTAFVVLSAAPALRTQLLDALGGGRIDTADGLSLVFPAGAVKDLSGNVVEGEVDITYTLLNTPELLAAAPGGLMAIVEEEEAPLESFGMVEVRLEKDGQPLQLDGAADLVFPAIEGSVLENGKEIGLFYFDEAAGVWRQEGIVQMQDGNVVATVTHFSWWNADIPFERNCVAGTVVNSQGAPVVSAQVDLWGVTYRTSRAAWTDTGGRFCVLAKSGEESALSVTSRVRRKLLGTVRTSVGAASCGSGCFDLGVVELSDDCPGEGLGCALDEPCNVGVAACNLDGNPVCTRAGSRPDGWRCGANAVCRGGFCQPCNDNLTCPSTNPCYEGRTSCASGLQVCRDTATLPNGTPCGPSSECREGTCTVVCISGRACTEFFNLCHRGVTSCVGDKEICNDTGEAAPDGTSCGVNMECSKGACLSLSFNPAKVVLAESQAAPKHLQVDGTHVYWLNTTTGDATKTQPMRVEIDGGAAEPVGTATAGPAERLVLTPGSVVWASGFYDAEGGLFAVAKNGSGHRRLSQVGFRAMTADDSAAYFWSQQSLIRVSLADGTFTPVLGSLTGGAAVAIKSMTSDADYVYFHDSTARGAFAWPKAGGNVRWLAGYQAGSYYMTVDATNVYWAGGDVFFAAKAGNSTAPAAALATEQGALSTIASDGTTVFWIAGERVMKVARTGGDPAAVADTDGATSVAVDGRYLYWSTAEGVIYRQGK